MSAIHVGICIMILQVLLTESTPVIQNETRRPPCVKCSVAFKNKRNLINQQVKKDLFVSRGWGASGMPFNVLYMKSPHTAHFRNENMDGPVALAQVQLRPSHAQLRNNNSKGNKKGNVENGVPQLFVSYGWGPLGRK